MPLLTLLITMSSATNDEDLWQVESIYNDVPAADFAPLSPFTSKEACAEEEEL